VYADERALVPFLYVDYAALDAEPESGTVKYLFTNHLGVPERVEDESARTIWQGQVSPYGSIQVEIGLPDEINLRFPGHYYDVETGLHYNRFRYYDPVLGRYLQCDPLGVAGGYNLFAYQANPLTGIDILGLYPNGSRNSDGDDLVPGRPRGEGEAETPAGEGPAESLAIEKRIPTQEDFGYPPLTEQARALAQSLTEALNQHPDFRISDDRQLDGRLSHKGIHPKVGVITHPDRTITVASSGSERAYRQVQDALQPHLNSLQQRGEISGYRFGPETPAQLFPEQKMTCAEPRLIEGARTPGPNGTPPPAPDGMAMVWRGRIPLPERYRDPRGGHTMTPCEESCQRYGHAMRERWPD
jgi:RHS repeat-associated protein